MTAPNPAPAKCPTTRQLVEAFMDLPYHVRRSRAVELGIFQDGDDDVRGDEIDRLWAKRAKEKDVVHELLTGENKPTAPEPRPHIPIATLEECTKAESLPEGRDEPLLSQEELEKSVDARYRQFISRHLRPRVSKTERGDFWRQVAILYARELQRARTAIAPRVEAQPDADFERKLTPLIAKHGWGIEEVEDIRKLATSEPGWISAHCDVCHEPVTGSVHYELVSGKHRCCRCMNRLNNEPQINGPAQDAK